MPYFNKIKKNERGMAIVEATMLLPVCILMILAIYYASIFMCQKANLQANLQNALIYYKNVDSDTHVTAQTGMAYNRSSGQIDADGSLYARTDALNPYRFFAFQMNKEHFESFFRSMCGYMFFDSGDNVQVEVDAKNYVVYKVIHAKATQTVKPAISFAMIGLPDSLEISAEAEAVITNSDDLIRNVDFAFDLLKDTKLGEIAFQVVDKVKDLYQTFKNKFGIS